MAKKQTAKLKNPFIYQGYVSPDYFCDRIVETEELIGNLQNGRNTMLISPRRIGKTGLIKNTFYQLQRTERESVCIYIDIMPTKNQHEFVQMLGTAIAQDVLSREQQAMKRLLASFLTANQLSLLKALAKEGYVESPQSNGFITNHNLPSASSIKTALDLLLDKDMVQRTERGYTVSDFFFATWLKRLF